MRAFGPSRTRTVVAAVTVLLGLLLVQPVRAQEVGTVAALAGTVEIGRAGTWTAGAVGSAVRVGDSLRTGRPGRLQVVFRDDCVLNIADDTELVINEQLFEPERGVFRSLIHMARGKVKALVSEYYARPKARYAIETVTASAGVRGTEFVIVFDPVAEVTAVAGVTGTAEVHSVLDRVRHGVFVTSQEFTTVARGEFPAPPTPLDQTLFRQYLDGLQFIGATADSLTAARSAGSGGGIASSEAAAAYPGTAASAVPAPPIAGALFESHEAYASVTNFTANVTNGTTVANVVSPAVSTIVQPPAVLQQIRDNHGDLGVRF